MKHWICNCEEGFIYTMFVDECPKCETKQPELERIKKQQYGIR